MKVILVEDVPRLGAKGDVVKVKDGHARNYLIPSGKALLANAGNLARLTDTMKLEEMRDRKDRRAAERVAERLAGVSCTIRVQADEADKLYGSVGQREIAQSLEDQGLELEVHAVQLDEPIKMLGVYPVTIELYKGVTAEIRVWVVRE